MQKYMLKHLIFSNTGTAAAPNNRWKNEKQNIT